MHIVFFNRSFHPDISATSQLLTDLCEDLIRVHGCRVSVVTGPALQPSSTPAAAAGGGLVTRETHRGIEIHRGRATRFDKRRFPGRAANYVSYFLSACWAGLRVERPDVVVALTDPPIIGLAAWLTGVRSGAPLVMVFQDLFPEVTRLLPNFHSPTIDQALQQVSRFLCRRASRIVALGQTMRRRLIEDKGADADRIDVIENWADTSAITPGPKVNAFSIARGLADTFTVMHSGNIGLSQSLESLVDAAALLRDLPDVVMVFQGDGVKKADLEERVKTLGLTNVRFLPYADRDRLSDAFAAADVFVISLQRGLAGYIVPSKLYGILAAGRPYVAAVEPDCEVSALTERHGTGLLTEPGDARGVANRIRELYNNREMAARLGANARAASQLFDRAGQVEKYMQVLAAATTPGRPAALHVRT